MSVLSMMIREALSNLFRREPIAAAKDAPAAEAVYDPRVFDARDLESAKVVILNPMPDMTTEERWQTETRNLVDLLAGIAPLDRDSRVIDYGCGIGRLAKALIERHGCEVTGVDISERMRTLAREYVGSDRFVACSPEELDGTIGRGFRATHACACWVIQHCEDPNTDLRRIHSALAPGGWFFVLNSNHRWVPTNRGWMQDEISVEKLLGAWFQVVFKTENPPEVVSRVLASQSYAMLLRKT